VPAHPKPTAVSYRNLFRDSPEPAWVVEPATLRILETNARAEEFTGASQAQLVERTLLELVQPWDAEQFRAAIGGLNFDSPELRGITAFTRAGQSVEVDLLIRPTVFHGAEVWIVIFSDATPRVKLEEQLRQAQKMEAVGMLAGGIAHDFNNLLTIIAGYSHMLVASLANDPKNRSAAEQVIKASDRAAALTGQLLAFSRRQVLQPKVLNLATLVQGMTPMLRRIIGEHIDLRILPTEESGLINADSGQVEQVIMNLVVNARDAMPVGGTLLIETRTMAMNEPCVGRHTEIRPGHYVLLAVTDTGVGMDEKTREKVFEPFFTTKESGQGTGLGLSMVMGIVKRAGGGVDVYSEQGHGTTVKIYFPKADGSEAAAVQHVRAEPHGGWETVLLVEDEEAVRSLVRATLELKGYRVLVAGNGTEALRVSRQHAGPIHLLITDLVMPDMNGRDVARKLHRSRREMLVLYMSGYTDTALHHTVNLDRTLHFLGKPFTPSMLARKVREVLDENTSGVDRRRKAGS
jgi:two-component system cell cycle sensor histidine kinase/response regulator CckA